ncbi:hypothetical protein HYH03_007677 [Edaphochlamys debaryana]|uniref:Uncharacterized protein n=1 Tax=Edaphochlamys debaryana TaxID=47281 RepID=A0A835Y7V9_9CHLO|nr:hypothetical protein HYH03_007677 [Edaphochlamys debaryana]|eukprot:KAG2494030.1 hypothetical protein HYH03_007677 [Edaphochlamys debaryana]
MSAMVLRGGRPAQGAFRNGSALLRQSGAQVARSPAASAAAAAASLPQAAAAAVESQRTSLLTQPSTTTPEASFESWSRAVEVTRTADRRNNAPEVSDGAKRSRSPSPTSTSGSALSVEIVGENEANNGPEVHMTDAQQPAPNYAAAAPWADQQQATAAALPYDYYALSRILAPALGPQIAEDWTQVASGVSPVPANLPGYHQLGYSFDPTYTNVDVACHLVHISLILLRKPSVVAALQEAAAELTTINFAHAAAAVVAEAAMQP